MLISLSIALFLVAGPSAARAQKTEQRTSLTRAETKDAERRLAQLGYWTGPVDGVFEPATRAALMAFQKWEGRTVTGRMTSDELEAIRGARPPVPRDGEYAHVEVDIDRQVLLIVDENQRLRVLPVSTGTDKPFVYDGQTSIAYTPRGRFVVYEKGVGWEDNLPGMYYANYISGGIAIHGSNNVPAQPASHGCIRIPIFAAREVSKLMKLGTIVLVYDNVSFVSARSWVDNPKLKEAALANSALH